MSIRMRTSQVYSPPTIRKNKLPNTAAMTQFVSFQGLSTSRLTSVILKRMAAWIIAGAC